MSIVARLVSLFFAPTQLSGKNCTVGFARAGLASPGLTAPLLPRGAAAPELLARTGPIGPAPALPLDEIDIRIHDDREGGEFVRRLWWRVIIVRCEYRYGW